MTAAAEPSMRHSLSFVTLAVRDVAASTAFYGMLGLQPNRRTGAQVAFFQLNGVVLALLGRDDLDRTVGGMGVPQAVLSHNVDRASDIGALLSRVVAAGGTVRVPQGPTSWGGQRAWFADLDGHLWELVFNPSIHRDELGGVWLDGSEARADV